jgi:monomeric isocitrate dehydrogenase
MYETGAGGSAPKHVQQFEKEGHLRWDSLGEYLAMAVSLEDLSAKTANKRAALLAKTLLGAISKLRRCCSGTGGIHVVGRCGAAIGQGWTTIGYRD